MDIRFIGSSEGTTDMSNCYMSGTITGPTGTYIAALCGYFHSGSTYTMSNCYVNTALYKFNEYSVKGAVPKTLTNFGGAPVESFESGEIAYKLGDAFGQDLGVDNLPVFINSDNKVYQVKIYPGADTPTEGYMNIDCGGLALADNYMAITSLQLTSGCDNLIYKDASGNDICSRFTLEDEKPLFIPVSFKAVEAEYVRNVGSYANGRSGWETMIVPFSGDLYADDVKKVPFASGSDTNGNYWLKEFVGSAQSGYVSFGYATAIAAGIPYLIALPGDKWGDEYSFIGKTVSVKGENVEVSQDNHSVVYGDYIYRGPYINFTADAGYFIDKPSDENSTNSFIYGSGVEVGPFRCYFSDAVCSGSVRSLTIGNPVQTGMEQCGISQNNIYVEESVLCISLEKAEYVNVYNSTGAAICSKMLPSGLTRIENLPSGIYIVNGVKILLK